MNHLDKLLKLAKYFEKGAQRYEAPAPYDKEEAARKLEEELDQPNKPKPKPNNLAYQNIKTMQQALNDLHKSLLEAFKSSQLPELLKQLSPVQTLKIDGVAGTKTTGMVDLFAHLYRNFFAYYNKMDEAGKRDYRPLTLSLYTAGVIGAKYMKEQNYKDAIKSFAEAKAHAEKFAAPKQQKGQFLSRLQSPMMANLTNLQKAINEGNTEKTQQLLSELIKNTQQTQQALTEAEQAR